MVVFCHRRRWKRKRLMVKWDNNIGRLVSLFYRFKVFRRPSLIDYANWTMISWFIFGFCLVIGEGELGLSTLNSMNQFFYFYSSGDNYYHFNCSPVHLRELGPPEVSCFYVSLHTIFHIHLYTSSSSSASLPNSLPSRCFGFQSRIQI